ncbi:FYVE, RhoGEF and PH domain-containing protein 4-like [Ischnura elegans]|uniref:FYVE, RhoGEF and PH domain-containing protein 4-like n=1 Tax=Ischnura elegans TaxID=197161 RepID=UPI001ED8838D|nr:FYVE, RhoGEF and PH domain-containing protein 4-like [Ischnura elegans]
MEREKVRLGPSGKAEGFGPPPFAADLVHRVSDEQTRRFLHMWSKVNAGAGPNSFERFSTLFEGSIFPIRSSSMGFQEGDFHQEFVRSHSSSCGFSEQTVSVESSSSSTEGSRVLGEPGVVLRPKASPAAEVFPAASRGPRDAPGEPHSFPRLASFGGFPRFNPFLVSPPSSVRGCAENKIQMQSCRSSVEYFGSVVNTYRFSAEQVTQCYQDTGFDVSESESEDEEDDAERSISKGRTDPDTISPVHQAELRHALVPSLPRPISCAPSETDDASITWDGQNEGSESRNYPLALMPPESDARKDRPYKIANELLTTERSYVDVLHIIDQVFHFRVDQENRAHPMFSQEMIPQIFSNIKSIYQFHHDFLLPQLEERMKNWDHEKRIGDIMKNFAPFLKMYSEYVKNFDNAMNLMGILAAKHQRFAAIMDEIHQTPECGNLTLSHHMLSPIQRVPRYEMLLKDYLKKLPEDSSDITDTEKALHLVSTAANHANEAMKKIDKFKQLLDIQESISGVVDLVSPTRELIKEGKIVKISARSGDHQERYLFLFSDILFLCSPKLLTNRVISGPMYRLRAKFNVDNIQVLEGDNLETANTFYIRDTHKNVELYTQTEVEKTSWLDALWQASQELCQRKSSLKIGADNIAPVETEIGKRAPNFIKMDSVAKCMDCSANFSVMKRKHHCRACGLVVCGKCSNHKFQLPYEDTKASRVCRQCHNILSKKSPTQSPCRSPGIEEVGKENIEIPFSRGKGVLEVPADAICVLNGYLHLKTRGKSWVRRWFSLHPDFVLYSYRSHTDKQAMTATPLPGFTVVKLTELQEHFPDKEKSFKMYHAKKMYYFQGSSKDDVERWVHALKMAAQAELPSPEGPKR